MSEWKKVKLGEVAEIFSGYAFKSSEMNKESGTPLIKIKNINNFGVSKNCDTYLNKDVDLNKYKRFKLQEIDFLVAMTGQGSVGRIGKMKSFTPNFYVNQRVAIVRPDRETCEPYYAYLSVATNERQDELFNKANGAGQPNISAKQIGELEINLPSLPTQHRIATILSRYDSLIENYQKQIKLLEEAAQRLYKEWFVDLHFPGHKNTKIVDDVPEGWERKKVGDMISKIQRTKQVSANNYQTSGQIPVIDQSRNFIAGYTDDAECLVKVTVPYIVFGDHTRILKYIPFSFAKGADGTQLIMSNDLDRMPQTLFYNSLIEIDLSNYSYARHFKYLKEESVLLPSEQVARKYDSIVSKYYQNIQKSREQIRLLTEARDRLLPKLMNGEINV